jgi:hypothetical protein
MEARAVSRILQHDDFRIALWAVHSNHPSVIKDDGVTVVAFTDAGPAAITDPFHLGNCVLEKMDLVTAVAFV